MSWLGNIIGVSRTGRVEMLLRLRSTRLRQMMRNYGRILDLLADAAEKQGGDFILDKQYILTLVENLFDLADSIVFDLNVMTGGAHVDFYDFLERFHSEVDDIIVSGNFGGANVIRPEPPVVLPKSARTISEEELARAISRYKVLYQRAGQVACRGVAAGPVFKLGEAKGAQFPEGGVLVASDVKPDDDLIRMIRRASAILMDFGKVTGHMASLAREFRIPTIVGLSDAVAKLASGEIVTVDADEGAVYLGKIQELIDYYRTERLGAEEEPEYKLLRKLRRAMFSLSINADPGATPGLKDCKSLHDLVHLAHELGGEALVKIVTAGRDIRKASVEISSDIPGGVRVIDLGDGLPDLESETVNLAAVRSAPLRIFIEGLGELCGSGKAGAADGTIVSAIKDEHANIIIPASDGFDMADSIISENKESNYIYCRFANGAAGADNSLSRGRIAHLILSRLDFAAARTARAVSAWISALPRTELEERLSIIGRLAGYIKNMDGHYPGENEIEDKVEEFMMQYA